GSSLGDGRRSRRMAANSALAAILRDAHLRCAPQDEGRSCRAAALLPALREIFQVRRRLVLLHRHDGAVGALEIDLLADGDMGLALLADVVCPPDLGLALE